MESRQRKFIRSLRFKLCLTLVIIGICYTAFSCYRSYNKVMSSFGDYVDEELAQISSVIINYNVILPKSWRGNTAKRKVFNDLNGNIIFSDKKEKLCGTCLERLEKKGIK